MSDYSQRGLASPSISPERRRAISQKGGRMAHAKGVAHKWTSEQAKAASAKGVLTRRRKRDERAAAERE